MDLEELKLGVDVADQADPARQQQHDTDAAGAETLDAIGQFVLDVAGGHHGNRPLGTPGGFPSRLLIRRQDVVLENSLLACLAFFRKVALTRKPSLSWNSEDVFSPTLFQKQRTFSSFFSKTGDLIKKRRLFRG